MKMRIKLLLFIVVPALCQAQNTITGTLRAADNTPVDYANIVLLAQADSTFLSGTISGEDGTFVLSLSGQPAVSCLLRVTCIGYRSVCLPVQPGDMGTIHMESDTQMLGEVVVKGDLPVTRLKGDAMLTNVEGSVLAKAGTAQDMLNYIPGVASQKGELQVLGRGAPVVYINGRPMRDESELEQLSAENIRSVEVISNPGARYSASVKAVIRIQTKRAVGDGLGLSNRTVGSYSEGDAWSLLDQVNLNYRKGGLDVFGMFYLSRNHSWDKRSIAQNTYLDKHWQQLFDADDRGADDQLITDLGMNYVFNFNHSVGFKYRFENVFDSKYRSVFNTDVFEDGVLFEQNYSFKQNENETKKHSANFYYNGTVNDWNIDFNTDLLWMTSGETDDISERILPQGGVASELSANSSYDVRNRLYASKLVFSHPLFGGNVALGGEFSYTNRRTDYLFDSDRASTQLENNAGKIKENNGAAFVEFSRPLGPFELQAGLRYEHVVFDYYRDAIRQDDQSRKYDDFFPSVSISTSWGGLNMQLGYTQDIERPGFNSLRSSVYYGNHYTYETGNPFLLPTITHNLNFTAVYKWWQLYASYQRQKDEVSFTTSAYSDDDPNIILIKPINLAGYDIAYARLSATPTIGLWLPRFTLSVRKQWFDAEGYTGKVGLDRPQVAFRWQNSFKLPAGFLFGLNGSWSSKYDVGNIRFTKAGGAVDANLRKDFMNGRLSFLLNGSDLFLTRRTNMQLYTDEVYNMSKSVVPNTRSVSLTVRYRFNPAKDKYKGTGAGESQKNRL